MTDKKEKKIEYVTLEEYEKLEDVVSELKSNINVTKGITEEIRNILREDVVRWDVNISRKLEKMSCQLSDLFERVDRVEVRQNNPLGFIHKRMGLIRDFFGALLICVLLEFTITMCTPKFNSIMEHYGGMIVVLNFLLSGLYAGGSEKYKRKGGETNEREKREM